jgi:hypothetical protein
MQAVNPVGSTNWQIEGSWTVPAVSQIQVVDTNSLSAYLSSTRYLDFSSLTESVVQCDINWNCWDAGPDYREVHDGTVQVNFSVTEMKVTSDPSAYFWIWNSTPFSQYAAGAKIPVLETANFDSVITITFAGAGVKTFGFEAQPDFGDFPTITATFYSASSSLPISYSKMSWNKGSRIFAASGGPFTKVVVSIDDLHDFAIAGIRYSLDAIGSDTLATSTQPPAPAIFSPANGSTLAGSAATFQWSAEVGVSEYWLYVSAVAPGAKELYNASQGSNTSKTLTGLPTDGNPLYVRLWYRLGSDWLYRDYNYAAASGSAGELGASASRPDASLAVPQSAVMLSPANQSALPGSTVTFQWSSGAGVSEYWLYLSNVAPGAKELYNASQGTNTSKVLTGLPTDGNPVYLRLWYRLGLDWSYRDYNYTAASGAASAPPGNPYSSAVMLSPANGSTLPGSTATFQWSSVAGISEYWLYVSKVAPGAKELYNASQGANTLKVLTGLPTDGNPVYVRLWYRVGSVWSYLDYSYKSPLAP